MCKVNRQQKYISDTEKTDMIVTSESKILNNLLFIVIGSPHFLNYIVTQIKNYVNRKSFSLNIMSEIKNLLALFVSDCNFSFLFFQKYN